jgi:hypothetical protein
MKLKTNLTFIKGLDKKIKNIKNKDWSWNINNQKGQVIIFRGGYRKKEKIEVRSTGDKSDHNQVHTLH